MTNELSIYTLAVQPHDQEHQTDAKPLAPPIVPSVGFTYPNLDQTRQALVASDDPSRYAYARHGGPTQLALEQIMARLEGAEAALSFSSGMAALHAALLACVPSGGQIVAAQQLYGGTCTLLTWLADNLDMTVHYADFLDPEAVRQVINQVMPDAVICEVLTNPLIRVVPIDVIIAFAHDVGAIVIVDNTFATPFLLRPIEIGADVVVHSTTKYLNGHGDVLGGVIAGPKTLITRALGHRNLLGATLGPFEAWLTLRGLRTFAVRMRHGCLSARQVAAWLVEQQNIAAVFYPGLSSDAGNRIASVLFQGRNYGAIMAFELKYAEREETFAFVERLKVIQPVTSLGDINSLISHPATSSHRNFTRDERLALGITEGTLRLSIGIEDPNDLIADLQQALADF
jgi:cystathionine beta-lyase/cystathionine gamma-synthase